jgi:hypothetical protein
MNMKGAAKKAIADVHKSGTHVPPKDFSSRKKEAAAAGTGGTKKGSLTIANSLPMPNASDTPVEKRYEGSSEDWSADYREAKRRGQSTSDYEDSARDRVADVSGQRRMDAEDTKAETDTSEHYRGKPAFQNKPKASHGFGHSASQRDGHLRTSGNSQAHQIGKRK